MSEAEYYGRLMNMDARAAYNTRARTARAVRYNLGQSNGNMLSGADVESGLFGEAQNAGRRGDVQGSLKGGFGSRFAGLKQDIRDLSQLGAQLASSLETNLGNAFGDFITGAQKGKDAFRSFAVSVLNDAARAFASKAVQSLLGMVIGSFVGGAAGGASSTAGTTETFAYPGGGQASGGIIHRAAGGDIPAMVMKGEMIFGPAQAKRIGYSNLSSINSGSYQKRASGGPMYVGSGSGYQDDVPLNLAAGSFVVRKAMVDRYGAGYLSKLAGGGMPTAVSINSSLTDAAQPTQSLIRGYSTGGGNASTTAYPSGAGWGGSGGAVSVNNTITINDQRTSSQTESSSEGLANNRQLASQLARAQEEATMRVLQKQTRVGGMLRPGRNT